VDVWRAGAGPNLQRAGAGSVDATLASDTVRFFFFLMLRGLHRTDFGAATAAADEGTKGSFGHLLADKS